MIRLVSEELANQAFRGLESRKPGEPWANAFAYALRPGPAPRSGHLGIRRFAPGVGHLQVWEDVKAKGYPTTKVLRTLPQEVRDRLLEELRKRICR